MVMLTAAELAVLREVQEEAMPDTCTIQRRSLQSDGMGGYTESWSDLATGVRCRIASARYRPEERAIAEQVRGKTLWMLTLPAGQDITARDRVIVSGVAYEVVGLLTGGAWETARRVLLQRVD